MSSILPPPSTDVRAIAVAPVEASPSFGGNLPAGAVAVAVVPFEGRPHILLQVNPEAPIVKRAFFTLKPGDVVPAAVLDELRFVGAFTARGEGDAVPTTYCVYEKKESRIHVPTPGEVPR